jgi:transposase InsO family protein
LNPSTVHGVLRRFGLARPAHLDRATAAPLRTRRTERPGARRPHQRTRAYRPRTNGKVERYNRTLLEECAYAQEYRS